MVIGIFRSRLREGMESEGSDYELVAERMAQLVRTMPGFRSVKTFAADDGERVTVFEFETLEQLLAWRNQPEHRQAQGRGRAEFYTSYDIFVCDPIREAHFKAQD